MPQPEAAVPPVAPQVAEKPEAVAAAAQEVEQRPWYERVAGSISSATHSAVEGVSSAAHSVAETAQSVGESVGHAVTHPAETAAAAADTLSHLTPDQIEHGALSVAEFVPGVGTVIDGYQATTGRDLIDGHALSTTERATLTAMAVASAVPFAGAAVRGARLAEGAIEAGRAAEAGVAVAE